MLPKVALCCCSVANATDRSVAYATEADPIKYFTRGIAPRGSRYRCRPAGWGWGSTTSELSHGSPLSQIPRVHDWERWTYRGAFQPERSEQAMEAKVARGAEVCGKFLPFPKTHPSQALRLLLLTAGSCSRPWSRQTSIQIIGPTPLSS